MKSASDTRDHNQQPTPFFAWQDLDVCSGSTNRFKRSLYVAHIGTTILSRRLDMLATNNLKDCCHLHMANDPVSKNYHNPSALQLGE